MVVTNNISNFVVQHEIWTAENELIARYIALAISCIDKTRTLYFSFEQPPVLNGEGGTLGPRPACRVQFTCTDLNTYRQSIQKEHTNPQMAQLIASLNNFVMRSNRIFYEKVSVSNSIFIDIKDYLSEEEQALLKANNPLSDQDFTPETEDFYLLPDATVHASSEVDRKFEVQHIFWAKPELESVAKKVARFICALEERSSLFFPIKEEWDGAELPTFLLSQEFLDLHDYKNRIETEQNTKSFSEAFKLLAICCKNQTRQFWKLQIN